MRTSSNLRSIFPKTVRSRSGNLVFREAVPDDKERILNIRKNLYDGLDFMLEFFPQLVSPINGSSLLVLHEDKASNLVYIMDLENIHIQERDMPAVDTVLPIAFNDVAKYINCEDLRNYLFPYKRILVDMVPYKLMESNTIRMKDISGEHTRVFSDVTDGKNGTKGILSFGTLFKAQKVSYVYGIEIYGTDIDSIRKHILKHVSALKENASGSVCIMFFIQENIPGNAINDICLDFEMERVNYPGTKIPYLEYSTYVSH